MSYLVRRFQPHQVQPHQVQQSNLSPQRSQPAPSSAGLLAVCSGWVGGAQVGELEPAPSNIPYDISRDFSIGLQTTFAALCSGFSDSLGLMSHWDRQSITASPSTAPAKILVVDDELDLERLIRQRFRRQIREKTLDFLFAADGAAALDCLEQNPQVDMVLTDINMPRMDGLTFLARLSALNQSVRAVVISAYSDMPNIRRAMNRGAFDFLTKPIDFQDLEATIQKTLDSVQQARQAQQQMQQTQQALLHAAYHDSLTGLPNREWLMQRLEQLALQAQENYAVLFIDLDRFKAVNDSYGHRTGDLLLQNVAQRIQSCLTTDQQQVVRLGGDEFAVVLENLSDLAEASAIAQKITVQMRRPFQLDGLELMSGASVGLAFQQQQPQQSPDALLHAADVAMYCAKVEGQGFKIFEPTMQIPVASSLAPTPAA
jgi:diguanylate cyclase (GGDEF)-like protein